MFWLDDQCSRPHLQHHSDREKLVEMSCSSYITGWCHMWVDGRAIQGLVVNLCADFNILCSGNCWCLHGTLYSDLQAPPACVFRRVSGLSLWVLLECVQIVEEAHWALSSALMLENKGSQALSLQVSLPKSSSPYGRVKLFSNPMSSSVSKPTWEQTPQSARS